jgi:hypothetical protein
VLLSCNFLVVFVVVIVVDVVIVEITKTKLHGRERTIPTERPPPVGEVSANFCG